MNKQVDEGTRLAEELVEELLQASFEYEEPGSSTLELQRLMAAKNAVFAALRAQRLSALEKALRTLIKYSQWQIKEGGSHHPTLPSAVEAALSALSLGES